jgi:hypothetical protein
MISYPTFSLVILFIIVVSYVIYRDKSDFYGILMILIAVNVVLLLVINDSQIVAENFSPNGCTAGNRGLVFGSVKSHEKNRITGVIYSDDIVHLYTSKSKKKLNVEGQYNLIFSNKLAPPQKCRIKLITKDQLGLKPIHFGDLVKLVFNVGLNQNIYMSHKDLPLITLTQHNQSPHGEQLETKKIDVNCIFQLINPKNLSCKDMVTENDNVFLKTYSESDQQTFVKIDPVGFVTGTNNIKMAISLNIRLSPECGPNWKYDSSDGTHYLVNKNDVSNQLSNIKNLNNIKSIHLERQCMDQMREIIIERAQLQAQIKKLTLTKNMFR